MKTDWTRFNRYLYKYWRLQTAVILMGAVTVLLSLVNPYLAKILVDKVYADRDMRLFLILGIIGGGIFVLSGFIGALATYFSRRINCRVGFDITRDVFRHLQSLSMSFFEDKSTGEHIYKINNDVNSVTGFVCNTTPQIVTLFPKFLFILAIVFYLSWPNWKLSLLAILLFPINCINPYLFRKYLRRVIRSVAEKIQSISLFRMIGYFRFATT